MSQLKSIRKFLAAAAGVAVAYGLIDDETAQALVSAGAALLVYVIPND